jgi:hypothetical protein
MHYFMKRCTITKLDWSQIGASEAAIHVFQKPGNPCCAHLREMQSVSEKRTFVELHTCNGCKVRPTPSCIRVSCKS